MTVSAYSKGDSSVTTALICQGSGNSINEEPERNVSATDGDKCCRKLYSGHDSATVLINSHICKRAALDQDSQSSSMDGKGIHKAPPLTEAVQAVVAAWGERDILWGFVVTGKMSTCQ